MAAFVRPALALVLALGALSACKFVKTEELAARAEAAKKPTAAASSAARWTSEVLPYVQTKSVPLADIRKSLAEGGLDAAGNAYGYREVKEGAPFNFLAKVEGTIVAANTQSRAATADVDTDGDGKADATLQLGPVIKGTSIRDVLPFVSFTSFSNQIEFADVAKAFNTQAYETALKNLPKDGLVGQHVSATGAFTLRAKTDKILVTPVSVTLGGGA